MFSFSLGTTLKFYVQISNGSRSKVLDGTLGSDSSAGDGMGDRSSSLENVADSRELLSRILGLESSRGRIRGKLDQTEGCNS